MLVYGKWKVGKTSLLLRMIDPWVGKSGKEGPIGYILSADRGTKKIHLEEDRYKGRIAIAYPSELWEWRKVVADLGERIEKLAKSRPVRDLWVFLDTVTHMQINLMTEARQIDVRAFSPKKNQRAKPEDSYVRDATTQVDYGINMAHMGELTNSLLKLPANIVMVALEKEGRDSKDRTTYMPALSGQSREKITGDADIVARMVIDPQDPDKRIFLLRPGTGFDAGDRTGRLDASEPADLAHIQDKILGPRKQPSDSSEPNSAGSATEGT